MTMSISLLNTQIESATRRAERMCSEYDENNRFWRDVDDLYDRQKMLGLEMEKFTEQQIRGNEKSDQK